MFNKVEAFKINPSLPSCLLVVYIFSSEEWEDHQIFYKCLEVNILAFMLCLYVTIKYVTFTVLCFSYAYYIIPFIFLIQCKNQ